MRIASTGEKIRAMTADLTFSFAAAAQGACQDHPKINDHVLLAWVDEELCADESLGTPLDMHGSPVLCAAFRSAAEYRDNLYATAKKVGSCVTHLKPGIVTCSTAPLALLHYSRCSLSENAINAEKELSKWFVFFHELGHIVCKRGLSGDVNTRESCADAYAALRLLQTHGDVALGYIARLAVSRTMAFLRSGQTEHMTFRVLNAIVGMYLAYPKSIRDKSIESLVSLADGASAAQAYTPQEQEKLRTLYRPVAEIYPHYGGIHHVSVRRAVHTALDAFDQALFLPGMAVLAPALDRNGLAQKDGSAIYRSDSAAWRQEVEASDFGGDVARLVDCLHLTPTGRGPRPQIMGF